MIQREDLRIRDPFVYVEAEHYYLLGTTDGAGKWNWEKELHLYRSGDLRRFTDMGCMVKPEALEGFRDVWAPELHRYEGKYYLVVSLFREDLGRGSMILCADTVTGPYEPLTGAYITPAGWGCLDASLFSWKGKPYLFFSNEWTTPVGDPGEGALYVAELTRDLRGLAGVPEKIISGKYCGLTEEISYEGYRGYVAEGPYAMEEQGRIALYWSAFTKGGYSVLKSTAQDVFGPYRFEKTVFEKDGGHCMVFDDLQGVRQMTLHQPNSPVDERMKLFSL